MLFVLSKMTTAFCRPGWMVLLLSIGAGSIVGCNQTVPSPSNRTLRTRPIEPPVILGPPSAIDNKPTTLPALSISNSKKQDEWKPTAKARSWKSIVIHHTATTRGSVESIHETHLKRKDSKGNHWLGIGYHFVIGNGNGMGDGEVQPTFRWREQMHGAHAGNRQHNQHGIGIALIGNFENEPPTDEQLTAVKGLVAHLKSTYGLTADDVIGHGDFKATACPGKLFPMEDVR